MRLVISFIIICIFTAACSNPSAKPLVYGIKQIAERSAVWVAVNGRIQFLIMFDNANVDVSNENWEGDEFNIYYELSSEYGKRRIFVYGDIERGIVTVAYNNNPLDLKQGTFFADRDGRIVALTETEKEKWLDQIDPATDGSASAPPANILPSGEEPANQEPASQESNKQATSDTQHLTVEGMDRLREERKDAINQDSPLGEEIDYVEKLRKSNN